MSLKTLDDLFLHFLKDMYFAEKQLVKALPKMAKKASSPQLAEAFESHLAETKEHVSRLEQVFEIVGKTARAETCPAIKGIVEEGEEIMSEAEDPEALDAGLIAAAQAAEHYEIARYGTMVAWAEKLGIKDAVKILNTTLDEEYSADKKLSALAEGSVNKKAA
ncbi:YciE/YciF ferroxidase family protein [Bauldia litoralis]|uniref:Ferritin-like metal-binding protein YciE n=1 Tax=Bauldia litoralis TaxID=665467 RepID=A0A1G6DTL3_9HYPH|nr:ferritin-like domain-containing protein [Bauldia litoralis]SDB48458.1 Ferritin-like metal-binding protein YciE [Bauldia litoralis]